MNRLVDRLTLVFGIDLRTLALFRVGLGTLLLADLLMRARDLRVFYTDFGVLPTSTFEGPIFPDGRLSFHLLSGSFAWESILFLIAAAFALALMLGYRTKLATVVSWLLLMSLQNRNPVLLQGGDNLLLMLMFWAMFLPLGARFSVDAALAEDRNQKDNRYFSVATLALLVQCMSVYFFSAFLKSDPAWVPLGSATFMALQLDYMATGLGRAVREFPQLTQWMTYFVWALELAGPVLMFTLWFRVSVRLLMQFLFISMHVGFVLSLNIGLFPFISIVSLLSFTPPEVWDWLGKKRHDSGQGAIEIYYDGDCEFCRKICLLLKTFLILPEAVIRPAQDVPDVHEIMKTQDSWVIKAKSGEVSTRWSALIFLLKQSPILFWKGWLLGARVLRKPGDAFYGWVARNRIRFTSATRRILPYGKIETRPHPIASVGILSLFVIVLLINITSLEQVPYEAPKLIKQVKTVLRLDQKWNMFAPHPQSYSIWIHVPGYLEDGRTVNAFSGEMHPPEIGKPDSLAQAFQNYRWRKYLFRIQRPAQKDELVTFAQYLCRKWQRQYPRGPLLQSLQVYVVDEQNRLDWISGKTYFADKQIKTTIIHEKRCAPADDASPATGGKGGRPGKSQDSKAPPVKG